MVTGSTRPTTNSEFLERLEAAIESLISNCERFSVYVDETNRAAGSLGSNPTNEASSASKTSAIVDISMQLRMLLLPGKGNDLVRRISEQLDLPAPTISIGPPATLPEPRYEKVPKSHDSLGALPRLGRASTTARVSVDEFLDSTCIAAVSPGLSPITLTWRELVTSIANKLGVHVDAERPVLWGHINQLHVGLVPTISFLLYRLAVTAIEVGNQLLIDAGQTPVPSTVDERLSGMTLFEMTATEWLPRPEFRIKSNDLCPCGSGRKWKRCHRE